MVKQQSFVVIDDSQARRVEIVGDVEVESVFGLSIVLPDEDCEIPEKHKDADDGLTEGGEGVQELLTAEDW